MPRKKTGKKKKAGDTIIVTAEKQRLRLLQGKTKDNIPLSKNELDELRVLEKKYNPPKGGRDLVAFNESEVCKTQAAASEYAGVDVRTIRRWVKGGMLRTSKNFYIKSQLDIFKMNSGQAPTIDKVRESRAKADMKENQAALLKLELESKQDVYHRVDDCLKADLVRIAAVKRAILGMDRIVAKQFPPKIRRRIAVAIKREAIQICNDFAEGRE